MVSETQRILKQMKTEQRTPIADEMYLPNHSGDLSKGRVLTTPTTDYEVVNKLFLDTNYLTETEIGNTFLKLDASNDPITENLQLSKNLIVDDTANLAKCKIGGTDSFPIGSIFHINTSSDALISVDTSNSGGNVAMDFTNTGIAGSPFWRFGVGNGDGRFYIYDIRSDEARLVSYFGGELVINESGADRDFRVESDTNQHAIFLQASDSRIGFGENNPDQHIHTKTSTDTNFKLETTNSGANLFHIFTNSADNQSWSFGQSNHMHFEIRDQTTRGGNDSRLAIVPNGDLVINASGEDLNTRIEGNTDENLLFIDAGADNIGIGTATPNTSAKLDISSTTGALLIPRMTTTKRNALTATDGMIIYNTTTTAFNFYEDGAWVSGSGLA